MRKNKQ